LDFPMNGYQMLSGPGRLNMIGKETFSSKKKKELRISRKTDRLTDFKGARRRNA